MKQFIPADGTGVRHVRREGQEQKAERSNLERQTRNKEKLERATVSESLPPRDILPPAKSAPLPQMFKHLVLQYVEGPFLIQTTSELQRVSAEISSKEGGKMANVKHKVSRCRKKCFFFPNRILKIKTQSCSSSSKEQNSKVYLQSYTHTIVTK